MPPRYRRTDRINSLLKSEISDIIGRDLKDPGISFSSVIRVETTGDLRHARVRISVMGSDEEKRETMKAFTRASSYIRDTLMHRLDLRRIPQLEFILDENIEYSLHIAQVLNEIKRSGHE